MKGLDKRKYLASKVLGAGKNKIVFGSSRLEEIKEAMFLSTRVDDISGAFKYMCGILHNRLRERNEN